MAIQLEPERFALPRRQREYRYYDLIMAAYVCVLLCANLIGPAKVSDAARAGLRRVTFLAGVLFFPISYIFGDILTEVYGYARDRRVVWAGFAALVFASFMAAVIVHLPPAPNGCDDNQAAVEDVFGNTWRIVGRLDHRLLVRLLRQQLRAGEDEAAGRRAAGCGRAPSARPCAARLVDSALFYTHRLLRHLADRTAGRGDDRRSTCSRSAGRSS